MLSTSSRNNHLANSMIYIFIYFHIEFINIKVPYCTLLGRTEILSTYFCAMYPHSLMTPLLYRLNPTLIRFIFSLERYSYIAERTYTVDKLVLDKSACTLHSMHLIFLNSALNNPWNDRFKKLNILVY